MSEGVSGEGGGGGDVGRIRYMYIVAVYNNLFQHVRHTVARFHGFHGI